MIELRDRKIFALPPLVAAVVGVPDTAVVSSDHAIGAGRIDPDVMEIAVCTVADAAEALPAIGAHHERTIGLEDAVLVFRIDDEIRKIEWAPDHSLTAVAHLPGASAIAGTIERVFRRGRLDECVDDVGVRWSNGDRDAAPGLGGQTFRGRLIEIAPA